MKEGNEEGQEHMEPEKENPNNSNNRRRKKLAFLLLLAIVIAGIAAVYFYTNYKKTHITTDDAYVTGRIHFIASKVPGTVKALYVNDNQFVKKGDLLLEIDKRDYEVRRREAQSALDAEQSKTAETARRIEVAHKQLSELIFRCQSAQANLVLQEANRRQAEADLQRAKKLFQRNVIPEERIEKAQTVYDVTAAQVQAARDQLRQAEAALVTQKAVITQTEAALKSQGDVEKQKQETLAGEDLRYSYTQIYAPRTVTSQRDRLSRATRSRRGSP